VFFLIQEVVGWDQRSAGPPKVNHSTCLSIKCTTRVRPPTSKRAARPADNGHAAHRAKQIQPLRNGQCTCAAFQRLGQVNRSTFPFRDLLRAAIERLLTSLSWETDNAAGCSTNRRFRGQPPSRVASVAPRHRDPETRQPRTWPPPRPWGPPQRHTRDRLHPAMGEDGP
jgi:hypothetical protein